MGNCPCQISQGRSFRRPHPRSDPAVGRQAVRLGSRDHRPSLMTRARSSVLTDPGYCSYSPDHPQFLLDRHASRAALQDALTNLTRGAAPSSTVLLVPVREDVWRRDHAWGIACCQWMPYAIPTNRWPRQPLPGALFSAALRALTDKFVIVFARRQHRRAYGRGFTLLPTLVGGRHSGLLARRGTLPGSSRRENGLFAHHLLGGLRRAGPGLGESRLNYRGLRCSRRDCPTLRGK